MEIILIAILCLAYQPLFALCNSIGTVRSTSRISPSIHGTWGRTQGSGYGSGTSPVPTKARPSASAYITASASRAQFVTSRRPWHSRNSTTIRRSGSASSVPSHYSGRCASNVPSCSAFPNSLYPSGYNASSQFNHTWSTHSSSTNATSSVQITSSIKSHISTSEHSLTSLGNPKTHTVSEPSKRSSVSSTTSIASSASSSQTDTAGQDVSGGTGLINGTNYPWNPSNATCDAMNNLNASQMWNYVNGDSVVQSFNSMYASNQLMCSECFGMERGACTSTNPRCQNGLRDLAKPPGSSDSRWDTGAAIFAQDIDLADLNCDIGSTECSGAPSCNDCDGPGAFALLKSLETSRSFQSRSRWTVS